MRNEETMCEGLLSVVIPVYNIRDYVERCVRSVLAQPDVPLEVLIVDDGSTDDSGAVCDALAAEDSRVTVIHKPNGGLSDARNYGLCHAQGEYILFMDGDDWLAENVCPGLLQMALQDRADVVIGKAHFLREEPVMTRWEEAVEKNFTFHTVYTGKEYLLKCLQTGGLRVEVGRHLYRTGFLRANGLQFCKGILHEDEEFTPRAIYFAKRIRYVPIRVYNYLQHNGSFMGSYDPKRRSDFVRAMKSLTDFAARIEESDPEGARLMRLHVGKTMFFACKQTILGRQGNAREMLRDARQRGVMPLAFRKYNFRHFLINRTPALFVLYYRLHKRR